MEKKFFILLEFKAVFIGLLLSMSFFVSAHPLRPIDHDPEAEIACSALPSSLEGYNQDVRLSQHSLNWTLSRLSDFLRKAQENNEWDRSKLNTMIKNLEQAEIMIQQNTESLYLKGSDIAYFIGECSKQSP